MDVQTQFIPVSQGQMPQWSRVGQFDKSRYPKTFVRDQPDMERMGSGDDEGSGSQQDRLDAQNPALRVEYLERSIRFLKSQHQEILASLHAEIEKLRNENKSMFALLATFSGNSNK